METAFEGVRFFPSNDRLRHQQNAPRSELMSQIWMVRWRCSGETSSMAGMEDQKSVVQTTCQEN